MEAKKTDKADLTNKSAFFFSIGLFVTMTAILAVFENKTYDEAVDLNIQRKADTMEEVMDVPPTDQPPPPPPQVQQPQVVEVPDEEKIED